jgi:hypothetical protein
VLSLGVIYLALGLAGFVFFGFDEFGYEEPVRLLGVFGVSTLLNIVHTFVGLVAVLAAVRGAPSAFAVVAMVAFTALTVFGVVSRLFPGAGDPLNQSWWNVALYALTAVVCGYVYWLHLSARDDR